ADLFAALPAALTAARERAPAIAAQLQDVQVDRITSRQALAAIPVLRKSELLRRQQAQRRQVAEQQAATGTGAGNVVQRVFGGFSSIGWGEAARVFASPGP